MKTYKIQKLDPEVALKLLTHTYSGIRELGYHNDKDFCIKAIKNKHQIYWELPYKLRNDKDILKATIDNAFDTDFIHRIPQRLKNQKVLDQILESNLPFKYDRLDNIIRDFGSPSKKETNILRAVEKIKEPLKTPYKKYRCSSVFHSENPYPLIDKKTGNKISLFSKFFVHLHDDDMNRAELHDSMQDIKLKKIALSFSPNAAFEFLQNDEITESQFAEIFANHFIKYTSQGYFTNRHWIKCHCDACMGLNWNRFSRKDSEKQLKLKKIVIEQILMKTKSLHKICVFLNFNEEFQIPEIINILKKKLNIKNKKTSLLMNIKEIYNYGELLVDDELKTRSILNNPKLLAAKILEFRANIENIGFFVRENGQNIFLQDINEEVFMKKDFIKEILPAFNKSYIDKTVTAKDIWLSKTAAKYINKFKDLKILKKIIYFQSHEPYKSENIMKYIHKDIKKEIIEYYLIQNYTLLPYSDVKSPQVILNQEYIKKIEKEFFIRRDVHFYIKIVNAYGIKAFKDYKNRCYIPEEYKNNKDFMINAVLKSYKTLRHASYKIKADPDVVYIAFKKSSHSFKSASKTLKRDKVFLDNLFSHPCAKFHHAHHSIKTDKDICIPAINSDINVIKDLSIRMIEKLNMNWFSDFQRDKIFREYVKKSGTHDVFLLAAKKHKLFHDNTVSMQ